MPFKAGAIYGEATLDTKNWTGGLKKMAGGVAKGVGIISAVFVAGMTKSIMSANEFQKSMSNVATIVDETAVSTQDLTKQLLQLDPALGKTTELTDSLYQSFSSGAETADEAMQTTIDSAMFAKAALTETATAVDILTSATNAYGKENINTTEASDIFFTAIKQGKLTGEQLAGSIGQSIPLFASTKIGLDELASGMAAMTKQGISANESTTQLNAIVNSFLKPSEELKTALEDVGYASGSAFLEAEGLTGALKLLEDQTQGDASELAKLTPNIRAMRGAMALTGKGGEEFTSILAEMEKSTGATKEAFDKQEKTFETFVNSMDKVQIVVGNIGKHFVDELAEGATTATEGLLGFIMSSEGMGIVSNIVGTVAGGFEVLKLTVQPIIDVIGPALKQVFEALTNLGNKLSGETKEGAGVFKIFAIASKTVAMALTLVSDAATLAINYIANLVDLIMKSGGVVGGFFEAITGAITWDEFGKRTEQAGKAFETMVEGVIVDGANLVKNVVEGFASFGAETDEMAADMKIKYTNTFENMSQSVENSWAKMLTGQDDFIGEFKENYGNMLGDLEDANDSMVDDTKDTTEELKLTWKDYFDTITSATSAVVSGVADITSQYYTNQQSELDYNTGEELRKLEEKKNQELLTEEQYNKEKEAVEQEAKIRGNQIAESAFNAEKLNKTASILMSASDSIAGWWSTAPELGPIAGPIFAGSMTALSGGMAIAQTALVNQQKFVPSYEGGGTAKGGLSRIWEGGGEIVNLPDGTQIIPNDISKEIANNLPATQSNIINISFAGAYIKDDMSLNKITDEIIKKLGKRMRLVS